MRLWGRVPVPLPLQLPLRVAQQARRRWREDRCTQAASSLAFQTALALVPLLAVAFALLKATGQLEAGSRMLNVIGEVLLPSSPEARAEIVQRLAGFADNIAAGAMGSLGLLVTIAVGFLLFLNVESYWNSIWSVQQRRPILNRFLLFYAAATLLPFALAVSLGYMTWLSGLLGRVALVLSWSASLLIFTVGNLVMPVTRVRLRAALWGGVISAILFELAKFGFSLYLSRILGSYKSIYGALGLLPLFLFWIYLAWLILLWGVEIAHAYQRLPALEAAERRADPNGEQQVVVSDALALHLLGEVARHFAAGRKALPEDRIEERYGLSEKAVRLICRRLEESDLLIAVNDGYLLARPAERIPVPEALAALRPALPAAAQGSPVGRLLSDLDAQAQARIGQLTLADLV